MKVLAPVFLLAAIAVARIIDGAQLTPFTGANVKVATNATETLTALNDYDYVIVGSGAGGGPVAARLAMAGFNVLLLEAGDDYSSLMYQKVPGLHPISTEIEPMRWDYFVKPYDSDAENRRSEKMTYTLLDGSRYTGANPPAGAKTLGLLYPRAGTFGGCTTHNALISVTPQESDWKHLQNVTGDASFAPAAMRKYLTKLEKATYVASGTSGHGFSGWYEIAQADLSVAAEDSKTVSMIVAAATKAGNRVNQAVLSTVAGLTKFLAGDANSASASRDTTQSLYRIPIAMKRPTYERAGPLDLLRQVLDAKNADGTEKYKLDVQLNTLATKIVFDRSGTKPRATGINFSLGASLYGADPRRQSGAVTSAGTPGTVRATREVIISAGSFNTPQLLKLSGVGPAAELQSFNIPVVANLPGVGKNLHDRYEAPVVARAQSPFDTIKNCTFGFTPDDPCMTRWASGPQGNKGLYSSNGGPISYVMKTSQSENGDADLMILGLAGISLTGYYPQWPINGTVGGNAWSWVTLKSHSRNTAGTVTLRSTNPQDMPEIVFRNFAVGGDADLTAAVEGTKWARSVIQSAYHPNSTFIEDWPGSGVQTDAQWKEWLKYTAWGHHACCTAKIGSASDPDAVLDGQFRVRGVDGLRVVDASSWSRIPGFYIVLPMYMLSEKAADVIIAAASA